MSADGSIAVAPAMTSSAIRLGAAVKDGAPVYLDLAKLLAGRALIQGSPGAGKSTLLRLILELLAGRLQALVIDPEGEFASLEPLGYAVIRFADAKRIGGALARHIRERRYSAVLDLSDARRADGMVLLAALFTALVEAPQDLWSPLVVAVDEAQLIAPHYKTEDIDELVRKRAIAAFADLMTRGRKRGLAGVVVTQRVAETAKTVISKCQTWLVGRTSFDRDLERAGAFLGYTRSRATGLRKLADGEFLGSGPALGAYVQRFRCASPQTRSAVKTVTLAAPTTLSTADAKAAIAQLPDDPEEPIEETEPVRRARAVEPVPPAVESALRAAHAAKRPLLSLVAELGETTDRLYRFAGRLGLDFRFELWTEEEIALLRECYAGKRKTGREIRTIFAARGFHRSISSLQQRATVLNLSKTRADSVWADAEKEIVRAGYAARKPKPEIVAELQAAGFDRNDVSWIAGQMGLVMAPPEWSEPEIELLRRVVAEKPRGGLTAVCAHFPNRPRGGVIAWMSKLGIGLKKPWTDEERQRLVQACERRERLVDIAREFDRPYANVAKMADKMKLSFFRATAGGKVVELKPRERKSRQGG